MRRRFRPVLALVAGALGVAYGTSVALVVRAAREDQRRPAAAIVVLGAAQYNGRPSPVLRARLEQALLLYQAGLAPRLVVTGGIGTGDRESEATVGRRYLVTLGVPDSAVVVVPEGKDTEGTLDAVRDYVRGHGLADVLLVSDGFHLARLRVLARRRGLAAWTSPARTSPITGTREWGYFLAEGAKLPVAWVW
ncbi:MAG TPA: YdcF family protein [Gemmatimonadales bacterium]|nr:YdcF family protein [Gemmatimonadales bacterium]